MAAPVSCASQGAAILRGRPVPYKRRSQVYAEPEAGLYHLKFSGLKQHTSIVPHFLWVRNQDMDYLGPLLQGLPQIYNQGIGPGCSLSHL